MSELYRNGEELGQPLLSRFSLIGTVSCFNGTDESGMCGEYKIISGVLEKLFSLVMVLSLNISNGFT
jgi:hypothetical protein